MSPHPFIIEMAETDSTSSEARRRLDAGDTGPFWVRADRQTQGRGRRGRTWDSREGNLFISGAYRLACTPGEAAQLSFAGALAVGDLIDPFIDPGEVTFKWPNDVKLRGRKVSGVLLEATSAPRGVDLIIGVGVNLSHAPEDAISVAGAGGEAPTPAAAGAALAAAFEVWRNRWAADGFAPLRTAWLARAGGLGAEVTARLPNETLTGVFEDLDADGALVMSTPTGRRLIRSGEVFFGADGPTGPEGIGPEGIGEAT